MVIEARDTQPSKAHVPILVTEAGIVIEAREEQPRKAESPILVTEEGITLFLHPATSVFVFRSIMQLFSLRYTLLLLSTVIDVRKEHSPKAHSPILVTEEGIVIEVREEQPSKAESPILVTESGIVIEAREEQPQKAYSPILVTEAGMVSEVREEHPEKAESPILVTEEGITLFLHPATSIFVFRSIRQLFLLR